MVAESPCISASERQAGHLASRGPVGDKSEAYLRAVRCDLQYDHPAVGLKSNG